MNILCVIDNLCSGGAQRQMVELALGFKKNGHIVSFLTYNNSSFYNATLDKAAITITCIAEPNYLKRLLKMRSLIRKGNQDVVLSFLDTPNFICELSGLPWRKWKLVVSERSANPNILSSYKGKIFRIAHLLADKVVCNSYANANLLRKVSFNLIKNKIEVIYNFIDFQKWEHPDVEYVPRKDGKLHLLVAASHHYLKNAKGLVEAIHLLPHLYKSKLHVDWYGRQDSVEVLESFNETNQLVNKYNLNNVIQFHQPTNEMPKYMVKIDAVGLFSKYEGLPNAICEAMACGKPVIATNVSDIPLIVEEGITGFLSETCNPNSIQNTLQKLMDCSNEELLSLGKKGGKKAHMLFNENETVVKYENIFIK